MSKEKTKAKPKQLSNDELLAILDKDISKNFGEDVIREVSEDILKREIIPVSPNMDIWLKGGIPKGSWVVSSGKPKCGKTTLALKFAKNCQDRDMMIFYGDVEGRLKAMNLQGCAGLDLSPSKFRIIGSRPGLILNAEQNLEIFERVLKTFQNCLLIIDSTSALCSSSEQVGDYTAFSRHSGPKLLAQFCRRNANTIPVNNNIVWCVQHVMANTSGYGETWVEDGGEKIKFQQDVKIRAEQVKYHEDEEGNQIGQTTHWRILNSALGSPSKKKAQTSIKYGHGIHDARELFNLGVDLCLIDKAGSWFKLSYMGDDTSVQGEAKVISYLDENGEARNKLDGIIREMYGI